MEIIFYINKGDRSANKAETRIKEKSPRAYRRP